MTCQLGSILRRPVVCQLGSMLRGPVTSQLGSMLRLRRLAVGCMLSMKAQVLGLLLPSIGNLSSSSSSSSSSSQRGRPQA